MIEIVVSLSAATICFLSQCHPVLVGRETPTGVFPLQHVKVTDPYYAEDPYSREIGDGLAFAKDEKGVPFMVHRVYLGKPSQERDKRIASPIVSYRKNITDGCVNVSRPVFRSLLDCCSKGNAQIRIVK